MRSEGDKSDKMESAKLGKPSSISPVRMSRVSLTVYFVVSAGDIMMDRRGNGRGVVGMKGFFSESGGVMKTEDSIYFLGVYAMVRSIVTTSVD